MAKISVVVPIYNVERYLRQCLDSIINQTFQDLEIILVDDESPDNCGAICDEYAARDKRIKVIHRHPNGGVSAARNDAFDIATGEWIACIDPDDWVDLDYLENMLQNLGDQKPDILCACGYYREEENKTTLYQSYEKPFVYDTPEQMRQLFLRTLSRKVPVDALKPGVWFHGPWDKLIRGDFLRENNIRFCPGLRYGDDKYFCFSMFPKARLIIGCMCIGYHYRQVPYSSVHGYAPKRLESFKLLFDIVYQTYLKDGNHDDFPIELIYAICISFIGSILKLYLMHPDNPDSEGERRRKYYKMRRDPIVMAAIKSKDNRYLMKNEMAIKYLMRQPFYWPVRLVWSIYAKLKKLYF